jgi:hypothetical protein
MPRRAVQNVGRVTLLVILCLILAAWVWFQILHMSLP